MHKDNLEKHFEDGCTYCFIWHCLCISIGWSLCAFDSNMYDARRVFQLDDRAVQDCFSTQRCFRKIEPCVIRMVFMFTGTGHEGAWFCGLIVSFLFIYSRCHVLFLYAGWFM